MTPAQAALLQKARESVRGAKLLADDGLFDFAASRAYYAMFYVAAAFLVGRGLTYSKHSAVHAAFGQHFSKTGAVPPHLHRYLLDAADARNMADYDVGPSLSSEDVSRLIAHPGVLRLLIGKVDHVLEAELKAVDALTAYAVLDRYPSPDPDRERTITLIDPQDAIPIAQQVREAVQHCVQPYMETTS